MDLTRHSDFLEDLCWCNSCDWNRLGLSDATPNAVLHLDFNCPWCDSHSRRRRFARAHIPIFCSKLSLAKKLIGFSSHVYVMCVGYIIWLGHQRNDITILTVGCISCGVAVFLIFAACIAAGRIKLTAAIIKVRFFLFGMMGCLWELYVNINSLAQELLDITVTSLSRNLYAHHFLAYNAQEGSHGLQKRPGLYPIVLLFLALGVAFAYYWILTFAWMWTVPVPTTVTVAHGLIQVYTRRRTAVGGFRQMWDR